MPDRWHDRYLPPGTPVGSKLLCTKGYWDAQRAEVMVGRVYTLRRTVLWKGISIEVQLVEIGEQESRGDPCGYVPATFEIAAQEDWDEPLV